MFKAIFFLVMLILAMLFLLYSGIKALIGFFSWISGASSNKSDSTER